jgi:cytoplasmic iron level regulating protein YaaA (DUF328/UPF0246 family)
MLVLLSPAKTLNLSLRATHMPCTSPIFLPESDELASFLGTRSRIQIKALMKLSDDIAELNYKRFQGYTSADTFPAGMAFDGPAYRGLDAGTFSPPEAATAQKHLRILSGLYGFLRPGDMIKPHRLEMGTKIDLDSARKTLYGFWGSQVTDAINSDLRAQAVGGCKMVVNLCSAEYWKVVVPKALDADVRVVDCVFRDNGRVVAVHAKRARGLMCRHIISHMSSMNTPTGPSDQSRLISMIQEFNSEGYKLSASDSSEATIVFNRVGKFSAPSEEEDGDGTPVKAPSSKRQKIHSATS